MISLTGGSARPSASLRYPVALSLGNRFVHLSSRYCGRKAVVKGFTWPIMMIGMLVATDVPAGDMQRIQGTWTLVSSESDGVSQPPDAIKGGKVLMIFEGDRLIAKLEGRSTVLGTFALDPTKMPKAYDRTYPDGSPRRGIYELEGETLKICIATVGKERPTAFATKPGDGVSLLVYKRENP
jgi:uncharacterized protein (TIGR03067 family)